VDVTGALLVDGQRFFQYIEGPPDGLEAVRRRIHDSRSHAAVAPVLDMASPAHVPFLLGDDPHRPGRSCPAW
jgi:hypothetical protein